MEKIIFIIKVEVTLVEYVGTKKYILMQGIKINNEGRVVIDHYVTGCS